MIKRLPVVLLVLCGFFAAVAPAFGQASLQVSVSANGFSSGIGAGGSQTLTATGIGQPVFAVVTVLNSGSSAVNITGVSLSGASEITLTGAPSVPFTLNPAASTSFSVEYLPASGNAATAQVSIAYTVNSQSSNFPFSLTGVSPRLTFSYQFPPSGGVTNLNAGDTIPFPATNLGSTTQATVNVANAGSASGTLNSVSLSGAAFQLTSSPAPVSISPGQQTSIGLTFAPQGSASSSGTLSLAFGGSSVSFSLTGSGTSPSFTVTYALADGNTHTLTSGATITFPAVDINGTTAATITVGNQGNGAGTVSGISVSGTGFQPNGLPAFPATVPAGQGFKFGIVFSPTQSGTFSGTFLINYSGGSISGSLSGSTAPSNISLAYIDPATNNNLPLPNNSTLPFANTLVGSVANVTLVAANTGTGTGFISAVSLGGANASAFQLLSLPPLPASVPPSQQATFGIRFSPQQQQTYSAALSVTISGQTLTINLSGQGTGPQYTYSETTSSGTTAFSAGGTVSLANTAVGQTASATISFTNAGTGNGQIQTIGVTGQGLSVSNLPALPLTLAPNASQQFTLNFAPTQPGAVTGQLTIGTVTFTVSVTGIGSQLAYSYANTVGSTTVQSGGTVIFTPIAVGSNETVNFQVQNTGTSAATISSINLSAASTVFGLQQLPALPLSLAPGGSVGFAISFAPNNTGVLTATLAINTNTFTLSGTGNPPPALPSYQFQGPSGTVSAAQQPAIGLTLSSAYPLPLQGVLTLTFVSSVFTDDPSIQFANGGRTVSFTVPANSTQALFNGSSSTTVSLQSGTTAGTIVLTPSFTTMGGYNLTPASPSALTLTIPNAAPQLTGASITSVTSTSFTLVLNGYSTTRVLTELDIQFTPVAGTSLSTSTLSISLSTPAAAWYQGTASQAFGGSFAVAVPFTLQGGSSSANLVSLLQSLSITAKNDVGTSSSTSVTVP